MNINVLFVDLAGPPQEIVFGDVDSTSMVITWGTPENDTDDGNILNYVVDCSSDTSRVFSLALTSPAAAERRAVLQGLLPYTMYSCCVAVETDAGRRPASCVQQTTLEEGADISAQYDEAMIMLHL